MDSRHLTFRVEIVGRVVILSDDAGTRLAAGTPRLVADALKVELHRAIATRQIAHGLDPAEMVEQGD